MNTEDIKINAENRSIGNVATEVSRFLNGKHLTSYRAHKLADVKVTVFNAANLKLGEKLDKKIYYHHTGYIGHLKKKTMRQVVEKHGNAELIKKAVSGMLPKNRLKDKKLKQLIVKEYE